jgi:hypothetical protein
MNGSGLAARMVYAVMALAAGAAAGFYSCMHWLPLLGPTYPRLDPQLDGSGYFKVAILVAAGLGVTLALFALTLPWIRHRKRTGRTWRTVVSGVVVLVLSLFFAEEGCGVLWDLVFAGWVAYTLAFTFVRYGIRDSVRGARTSGGYE